MTAIMTTRQRKLLFRALPLFLALGTLVLGIVFASSAFLPSAEASSDKNVANVEVYTVGYGETMWSISGRIAEGQPRSAVMQKIGDLNDLKDSSLQVGQEIFVPAYGD